jgi:molybdenum cofactor biosynthesis enzyme
VATITAIQTIAPSRVTLVAVTVGRVAAPKGEVVAAAVAATTAAAETTGEVTHNCHPADVVHGAVLMGMSTLQNGHLSLFSLSPVATTATATSFSHRHTGLAG